MFMFSRYSDKLETLDGRKDHAKTLYKALERDNRQFDDSTFCVLNYVDESGELDSHHEISMWAE